MAAHNTTKEALMNALIALGAKPKISATKVELYELLKDIIVNDKFPKICPKGQLFDMKSEKCKQHGKMTQSTDKSPQTPTPKYEALAPKAKYLLNIFENVTGPEENYINIEITKVPKNVILKHFRKAQVKDEFVSVYIKTALTDFTFDVGVNKVPTIQLSLDNGRQVLVEKNTLPLEFDTRTFDEKYPGSVEKTAALKKALDKQNAHSKELNKIMLIYVLLMIQNDSIVKLNVGHGPYGQEDILKGAKKIKEFLKSECKVPNAHIIYTKNK